MNVFKNIDITQLSITLLFNLVFWLAFATFQSFHGLPQQRVDYGQDAADDPILIRMARSVTSNVQNGNGNGNGNFGNNNANGRGAFISNGNSNGNANAGTAGLYTSFIAWGMESCPGNTDHMGASTTGSAMVTGIESVASDMICLPDIAKTRNDVLKLDNSTTSDIYAVFRPLNRNSLNYRLLRCAFCSDKVGHVRTLFGTVRCPRGWQKYYSGYLMTKSTNSIQYMTGNYCVKSSIFVQGTTSTSTLFSLSYVLFHDEPLSCAVCAK